MTDQTPLREKSANLKQALLWVGEMLRDHPERDRLRIVWDAQLRFDLNPLESEFLTRQAGMPLEE